ncbi:MAG: SET domain-containing protein-lysine N-methyltransferase [Nanoarchaeota archaeon]
MYKFKIEVRETKNIGKGILAVQDIPKGEVLFDWTGGNIYEADKCTDLPKDVADHAIQFEEHKWIDTDGIGRYFNHSCEPNCGIKGKFQVVAMKDIKKGEWCTWDYDMTEDSNWRMECKCGSKSCRKLIGAYNDLPKKIKSKYIGFISDWLVKKYNLN